MIDETITLELKLKAMKKIKKLKELITHWEKIVESPNCCWNCSKLMFDDYDDMEYFCSNYRIRPAKIDKEYGIPDDCPHGQAIP